MKPVLKIFIRGVSLLLVLTAMADDNVEPVATVQVATVRMEQTSQQITAYGRLVPAADGSIQVSAPYGCRIVKVLTASHHPVKAGDVLFKIAPDPDTQTMLDTARQTLKNSKQDWAEIKAQFNLKLANRQQLLQARQTVAAAQLRWSNLTAQGLGGDGELKAPCDGIVQQLNVKTGDLLGLGANLVAINQPARRELIVGVEPDKAAQLKVGQSLAARAVLRDGSTPFSGQVLRIGRTIDPSSGLVQVAAALDGAKALATQEYLEAQFEVDRHEALVIPASAVLPDGSEQIVYTITHGKAVRHSIKTETLANGQARILAGDLKAGDQVVKLGNYELEDGMKVSVEETP